MWEASGGLLSRAMHTGVNTVHATEKMASSVVDRMGNHDAWHRDMSFA